MRCGSNTVCLGDEMYADQFRTRRSSEAAWTRVLSEALRQLRTRYGLKRIHVQFKAKLNQTCTT